MTVTTATRRAGPFIGNGVTTSFPFAFKVFAASDLEVVLTDSNGNQTTLTLGTHYSVTLNADQDNDPGGAITYPVSGTPLTAPDELVAVTNLPYEQETDITNAGRFLPQVIENTFDYLTVLIQQMLEELGRALRFPVGSTSVVDVPTAAARAGKYLAFDADGNPTVSVGTGADLGLRTDLAAANGAALSGYTLPAIGTVMSVEDALDIAMINKRTKLFAATTFYVRADGSDLNSGLVNNSGGAFKTVQWASDIIQNTLDLNGFSVVVSVQGGAYTGGANVSGPWVGRGSVTFQGDTGTPANVTVTVANNDCFIAQNGAEFKVKGFKGSTTGSGSIIKGYLASHIEFESMDFGACAGMHIEEGQASSVICTGDYEISGGAIGHLHCGSVGILSVPDNITVTITNTPAFSAYFMGCAQGTIVWGGPTVTGTATGKRYLAHHGGLIRTPQAFNYSDIPGDSDGTMEAAGWIVGSNSEPIQFGPDIYSTNSLEINSVNFNTQAKVVHFKTVNDLFTPKGYFYVNGDDCYSSGRTHFGVATAVDVTTGTTDGATFRSPSVGASTLNISNNDLPGLLMRRRGSDGDTVSFYRNTTKVGSISVGAAATAYNTSSDYRLKQNVVPLAGAWDRVKALKPVQYEFRAEPGKVVPGFLAHELADVFPHAVTGEKDAVEDVGELVLGDERHPNTPRPATLPEGATWTKTGTREVHQGVDHSKLVADLTAALQEAMRRIEALEGRA